MQNSLAKLVNFYFIFSNLTKYSYLDFSLVQMLSKAFFSWDIQFTFMFQLNPFTPMSDQEKISLYNIHAISSRQVMRIKKNIN